MPNKPKRPCSFPSCPELTDGCYCDKHKKQVNHDYNKYKHNPAHKERYNKQWHSMRNEYMKQHPLCEACYSQGKFTAATVVHHKVFLENGGSNEANNLQSLCSACHNRIHNNFG